ncbi:helix-turn-helix transcriptional regulator, partial [Acinetobacter baumannii]|nr:helix-turn-helix transcriptional regulator [Acinetobacter baumannii]
MSINDNFLERGARLKAERNRLKLTQPEMAELIGKAVGSIVRYEKHGDALN